MLDIINSTPSIYVEESRDFQLLSRILNTGLAEYFFRSSDISFYSMIDLMPADKLMLLAHKLGFIINKYIPDQVLRNICKIFPYLIKNKGTSNAIELAAYTVFSAYQAVNVLEVAYNSEELEYSIISDAVTADIRYLVDLYKYIMPINVSYKIILSDVTSQAIETITVPDQAKSSVFIGRGRASKLSNEKNIYDISAKKVYTEDTGAGGIDDITESTSLGTASFNRIGYGKIIKKHSAGESAKIIINEQE